MPAATASSSTKRAPFDAIPCSSTALTSLRRSSAAIAGLIRDRLIAQGVPAERLVACGYGESRPVTEAGRTEFIWINVKALAGDQIHELARIAAVADVYDAITSERPYKPAAPAFVGVGIILDGSGTAFDPEIVEVFSQLVPPFPVGSEVRMPDGTVGVIAQLDARTRRPTATCDLISSTERPRRPPMRCRNPARGVVPSISTTAPGVTLSWWPRA